MPLCYQQEQLPLTVKGLCANEAIYDTLLKVIYYYIVHNSATFQEKILERVF